MRESHGDGKNPMGAGMGTGSKTFCGWGWDDPVPVYAQPWLLELLFSPPVLHVPNFELPLVIDMDAYRDASVAMLP